MINVELLNYTQNPVAAIEKAASTCYDSNVTDGKIMRHCYKSGHHSVLEFADFTFKITGVSRALTHQLVRHRCASYAQRSQRYCKENNFEYVTPPTILKNKEALDLYLDTMMNISKSYSKLVEIGIPAEDARYLLPNACETEICVKMNLRELIHFCNERLCTCAQWEIRQLANKMKKCVEEVAPDISKFLVPKCESHEIPYCNEAKNRSCGRHKTIKELNDSLKVNQ